MYVSLEETVGSPLLLILYVVHHIFLLHLSMQIISSMLNINGKKIGQGYTWYKPNAHNALVNATLTNVLVKFPSSEVSDMYNCGIHDFEVNGSLNGIIIKAQGVYELMFNFEIAVQSTNSYCRVEVDAGRSSYINGSSDQIGWFAGATAGIPEGASLGFSVSKTCFQNFLENEEIKFYTYSTTPIKIISMWIQMRRF